MLLTAALMVPIQSICGIKWEAGEIGPGWYEDSIP